MPSAFWPGMHSKSLRLHAPNARPSTIAIAAMRSQYTRALKHRGEILITQQGATMIGQAADTQRPQPIAALPNRGSHSRTPLLGGTPAPTPHPGTPKPRPLNQRRPRSCPGPPGWIGSPASRPVGVGALSTPARIGATGLQHRAHTGRRPRCGFIAAEPAANLGLGDRDQRAGPPR